MWQLGVVSLNTLCWQEVRNAIHLVVVLCGRDMQHRLRWADILKWVWKGSGLIDCVISGCNQGIGIGIGNSACN